MNSGKKPVFSQLEKAFTLYIFLGERYNEKDFSKIFIERGEGFPLCVDRRGFLMKGWVRWTTENCGRALRRRPRRCF